MKRFLVLTLLLLSPTSVIAQLVLPPNAPINWTAGDPNTTSYHWNNFSLGGSYPGPFAPDQFSFHPGLPNASLTELNGGGFLSAGGNLYSQGTVNSISAALPNYNLASSPGSWATTVFVQTRTLGNEIDYANLALSWTDGSGPHTLTSASAFHHQELEHVPMGGFGGFMATHIWGFNVPTNPSQFTLSFAGSADSVSLDQVRVDTFATPVPEPSSFLLVGGGLVALWRRRAKR